MESRTERMINLITDFEKTVSGLEKELGYSNGAFKLRDGKMSGKVLDALDVYFANYDHVSLLPFGDHTLIRRWGNGMPSYSDGIARFRDVYDIADKNLQNNGLWKRYRDWAFIGTYEKGKERELKKGWKSTGEIFSDNLGDYIILENSIKVYAFPKKVKEEVKLEKKTKDV